MAEGVDVGEFSGEKNSVLSALKWDISNILKQVENSTKAEIVDNIVTFLSNEFIKESRDLLFHLSVQRFEKLAGLEKDSLSKQWQIVNRRKGDKEKENQAKDIYDLFVFSAGLENTFPRDVLNSNSKNVDIRTVLKKRDDICSDDDKCEDVIKVGQNVVTIDIHSYRDMVADITKLKFQLEEKDDKIEHLRSEFLLLTGHFEDLSRQVRTSMCKCHDVKQATTTNPQRNVSPPLQRGAINTGVPNAFMTPSGHINNQQQAKPTSNGHNHETNNQANERLANSGSIDITDHDDADDSSVIITGSSPASSSTDSSNGEDAGEGGDEPPGTQSYAATVASAPVDGWQPVVRKKRLKWGKMPQHVQRVAQPGGESHPQHTPRNVQQSTTLQGRKQKHSANISLRGVRFEKCTDLYLQNIACNEGDTWQVIVSCVRQYAKTKGIRVANAWVKRNKHCKDMVGCRIRVPDSQVNNALNPSVWPAEVTCRLWVSKPRDTESNEEYTGNGHHNDNRDHSSIRWPNAVTRSWGSTQDLYDMSQREL